MLIVDTVTDAVLLLLAAYVLFDVARVAVPRIRRWRACRKGHRFQWMRVWNEHAVDPIGVGVACERCGEPAACKADWPAEPDWVTDFRALRNVDRMRAMVVRLARDEAYEAIEDIGHADDTDG